MPQIIKGSFTSTGAAHALNLVIDPDTIEVYIQGDATGSNWNSVANPAVTKYARWFKGMPDGNAFTMRNTAGAATDAATFITANGFYVYDGSVQTPGPAVVGTGISQAGSAVVTSAGHPFVIGDRLLLSVTTGMEQIEGITAEVTAVNPGVTYTIAVDSSAFAAPGTAITARRLPALPLFEPREMFINTITQANPMVVSVTETHPYHVGSKVRFKIPVGFGMVELNDVIGEVTAVGARTLTFGAINSTGFTAFAFPAAAAVPFTFAQIVPVGENSNTLADAISNTGFRGVVLGTSVCGPNGALVYYVATKADAVQ